MNATKMNPEITTQPDQVTKKAQWEITSEALGWIGVILVLLAYGLTTFDVVSGNSRLFMGLNLVGAVGIAIDAWEDKNIQPVALNIVWGVIAVIGIVLSFTS